MTVILSATEWSVREASRREESLQCLLTLRNRYPSQTIHHLSHAILNMTLALFEFQSACFSDSDKVSK